jgi:hypothetical protein
MEAWIKVEETYEEGSPFDLFVGMASEGCCAEGGCACCTTTCTSTCCGCGDDDPNED